MHATTQQLIDIRDGRLADVAVLEHVDLCEICSRDLKLIRERQQALRELPQLSPSPQVFAQLNERLGYENAAHTNSRAQRPLRFAVAAAVVASLALWMMPGKQQPLIEVASDVPPTVSAPVQVQVADIDTIRRDELLERSAALEAVSEQLAQLGSVEPASSTDEALSALEAQLALVDYNLNAEQIDQYASAELNDLLDRRVNTLENIVGVQRAELARQGFHGFQVMTASNIEEDQTW